MKKKDKLYYKNRIINYMFNDNFIEVPVFYNNIDKSIRFLLESKLEQRKHNLITNLFDDVFYKYGDMVIIAFGDTDPEHRIFRDIKPKLAKKYFKFFSLKKITKKVYYSTKKNPDYFVINSPFYIAYLSRVSDFNINKYLKDLYESNIDVNIVFLETRHGVAIHFYDDRGFDIVCEDKKFAKYLYEKYKDDIMDCNINFNE